MDTGRSTLRRPVAAAACGVLAAGVALAFGEMAAGVGGTRLSPVVAVGNRVIDVVPSVVSRAAIDLIGTADKAALIGGTCLIAGVLGGLLGLAARDRLPVGVGGFGLFGGLGVAAAAADPASSPAAALAPFAAAIAGMATLWFLITFTGVAAAAHPVSPPPATGPGIDRRRFLALAAGAAVLAASAASVGRLLQQQSRAVASRLAVRLPGAHRRAPAVPAGAAFDVDGVSPLFTPNKDFYRIDTALFVPQVPTEGWHLEISGMVHRPMRLTYEELLAADLVELDITLACVSNEVGGELVGNARWLGIPLLDLLDRVGVDRGADQVVGRSVDGFTAGFPVDSLADGRAALLAVGMNGEPLPLSHGFPARLVVAGLYGYVSATKWLSAIELARFDDFDAYWIRRGWARTAPVKTMSRIDTPRGRSPLQPGHVDIAGVAWAPTVGVAAVEVQVDDNEWVPARLAEPLSSSTWRQWVHPWDATPGRHVLRVRATDGSGHTQVPATTDPFPDGATGWHTVAVEVVE